MSILSVLPLKALVLIVVISFVLTCILPAVCIYVMHRSGRVSDPGLNNRSERTIPYIICMLCYIGCGWFLFRCGAPLWLIMFFWGGAAAIVVNIIVNRWWKISAHAASMGGLTALFFRLVASHAAIVDLNLWITAVIVLTGAVMTARIYLGRHTLMQTLAGVTNGFLCVWLLTMVH